MFDGIIKLILRQQYFGGSVMSSKSEKAVLQKTSVDLSKKLKIGNIIVKRLLLYFFPLKSYADRIFIIFSVVLSCVIVLGKKLSVLENRTFNLYLPGISLVFWFGLLLFLRLGMYCLQLLNHIWLHFRRFLTGRNGGFGHS